jgi:hypothetical protein
MRTLKSAVCVLGILAFTVTSALSKPKAAAEDARGSIVIVFKDGRQQSFRLSEIARIEFNSPAAVASATGRARFVGDWKVGMGGDSSEKFIIRLKPDGVAEKIIGSDHSGGTWTVVNGEARAVWDDGWTDVIRKVAGRWEKAAYPRGTSLAEKPANVAEASYTEPN